jgi:hypothetical protein
MRLLYFLIAGGCAWAQLERPQVGVMLDQNGDARVVWGVARSATLGEPILSGVLSMACAQATCVAKTAAAIVSTSASSANAASVDAPPGPAIFGSPYIYFPQPQQLVQWQGGALAPVAFTPDGDVLALRANGDGIDYAVERGGATWVEHYSLIDNSLRVIGSYGPVNAALLTEGATVLAASDEVHMIGADGTDTIIPVAGVEALIAMGGEYVELVTARDRWAMDLKTGGVFLLPGLGP